MTRVAVVGGGAGGIGAAWTLMKHEFEVTLFEADPHLGGHCFGVPITASDGDTIRVDAGVTDFNKATFLTVGAFLDELELEYYPVNQDASYMKPDGRSVWSVRSGQPRLGKDVKDPDRLLDEIRRFSTGCLEVLDDNLYSDWTARRYLDERQYSEEFRDLYFDPRAGGSFPMPDKAPQDYMIRPMVGFWRIHGVVGGGPAPPRMYLRGGMCSYPDAFARWMTERGGQVYISTRVVGIARRPNDIRIRAIDPDGSNLTLHFDHVVIAANPNQVIPMFEDASQEEARIFSGFGWQRARVAVHHDPKLMPDDRDAWGAYNYVISDGAVPEVRPTITFYANRLASLADTVPDTFVTVNPCREPDPDRLVFDKFFVHPALGRLTDLAATKVDALQGRRRTWYCGGYLREPFVHEPAFRSGVDVAERLIEAIECGGSDPWSVPTTDEGRFEDFLLEIPLFAGMDALALAEVQVAARPVTAPAGSALFQQGDPANGMYILEKGEVRVTDHVPGQGEIELARLGPGAIIGEVGLLDRGVRSGSAVAVVDSTGYFLSSASFEALRADSRPSAFAMMNRITGEVAARSRQILERVASGGTSAGPPAELAGSPDWPRRCLAPSLEVPASVLRRLPLFRDFGGPVELEQFLAPLRVWQFPRGQILYEPGAPPESCAIIVRGAVRISVPVDGRNEPLTVCGPGAVVGELALLDGFMQPARCEVCEEAILLQMDRGRFEMLRKGGGEPGFKFFEAVTRSVVTGLRKANALAARLSMDPDHPVDESAARG